MLTKEIRFWIQVKKMLFAGLLLSFMASACLMGCSGSRPFVPPPPLPDDRQHIPEPRVRKYNHLKDGFNKQFTMQTEQALDVARQLRHLFGKPKQALNVDAFDEVPNSSWFMNRNAIRRMSLEDIARGPDTGSGPDTTGKWTITRAKAEGVTPGFHIKDARGDRYLVKFDPPGYPELATGAEVVSTKLFHAAGYTVPENYIVSFHPRILELADEVKFADVHGKKRYMNQADLDELLSRVHSFPDGRIRALASKYIPGIPKGPFAYRKYRKDDHNDFVPHEHRRELRGLRVVAAWLNHTDTKSGNSFDTYITEDGKSYVKHYLIDFGSTLGSAAHGPMERQAGHENNIDPHAALYRIVRLGLYIQPWEKLPDIQYPSVGRYESELFQPGRFHFNVPNPAFDNCTNLDGFWGAKLVMSFSDEQLEKAVAQGQYSDPAAAAYLLRTIKERRDKTGRYWYGKINPLDRFELRANGEGNQSLCFADLAIEGHLEPEGKAVYQYDLRIGGKRVIRSRDNGNRTCIPLPGKEEQQHFLEEVKRLAADHDQWEFKIRTRRATQGNWSKWVKVFLTLDVDTGTFSLLGLERQE
jgi:hypothetical protein